MIIMSLNPDQVKHMSKYGKINLGIPLSLNFVKN